MISGKKWIFIFSLIFLFVVQYPIRVNASEHPIVYMTVGDKMPIPIEFNNGNYYYRSTNVKVVEFDNNGKMTALKRGNTKITLTYFEKDGTAVKESFKVKVHDKVKKLKWNKKVKSLNIGDDYTYKINCKVKSKKNVKYKWSSSDPSVAIVDSKGNVKAINMGNTIISCSVLGQKGKVIKTNLKVVDVPVDKIELDNTDIKLSLKETYNLHEKIKIMPEEATIKTLDTSSADENVVQVRYAILYAVGVGKTTVTVKSMDRKGCENIVNVTVVDNENEGMRSKEITTESNTTESQKLEKNTESQTKNNKKEEVKKEEIKKEIIKKNDTCFIAHRGLSVKAPENTVKAFELAGKYEFYGTECDVWQTKDGEFVISHDGDLKRMCGVEKNIDELTLEELKSYRIKTGANYEQLMNDADATTIPSLSEYLAICSKYNMVPMIEIKFSEGNNELNDNNPLYRLYKEVTDFYGTKEVDIISFNSDTIKYMNEIITEDKCDSIKLELLLGQCSDISNISDLQYWKENNIGFSMHYSSDGEVIKNLKSQGIRVGVWTLDDDKEVKQLLDWNVDFIVTNVVLWDAENK